MSRSGLLRAAALLAAGAAPLLAGSANAVEAPQLPGGLPDVGADKLISDATQHANPLEAGKAVKLPTVNAPVGAHTPALPAVPAAQERTLPTSLPAFGTLPGLPNPDALAGGTHIGDVKAPKLADLPTNGVVPNPAVLSGTLDTING